jgi:hypothetical protein
MRELRRLTTAVAGGAIALLAVAACTPDVVPIDGSSQSDRHVSTSSRTVGVCGAEQASVEPGSLLTTRDVWSSAGDAGNVASDMSLVGEACSKAVAADAAPAPVSCELGFPWYAPDELPTELARLGVTRVQQADLLRVRADRSVASRVTEYVLTLKGPAAAGLEQAALDCDGVQASGDQPPVYTIRDSSGGITVAVQIGYDMAVGLTFTVAGLNDATKLALLHKAAGLAAHVAAGG